MCKNCKCKKGDSKELLNKFGIFNETGISTDELMKLTLPVLEYIDSCGGGIGVYLDISKGFISVSEHPVDEELNEDPEQGEFNNNDVDSTIDFSSFPIWISGHGYTCASIALPNPKLHVMGVETEFESGQQLADHLLMLEKENKELKEIVAHHEKISGVKLTLSKV